MENRIENVKTAILGVFSGQIKSLKDDFDLEMGILKSKIESIEKRVVNLEGQRATQSGKIAFEPDVSVIAINVPFNEGENIVEKAKRLLHVVLELNKTKVVQAERTRNNKGNQVW